jgi:tricarballylate dehydrogenase
MNSGAETVADLPSSPDVLVIGGGNAGLCAALTSREAGAEVLLIEGAERAWRGGNSKYTRNLRCVHGDGDPVMHGTYTEEELAGDLAGVTGEGSDRELTELVIRESRNAPAWMERQGVLWQQALRGTLQLSRTNRFFLGGGKALVNQYYSRAAECGIRVAYETRAEELRFDGDRCTSVVVSGVGGNRELSPRAVVVAAGGFEANLDWLAEYWGDAAANFMVRGSRQNDGRVLRSLLAGGAEARGNPKGFHAIAVDARGPKYEGGIVTRVDSVPFSVMVNREGRRFYDEGEDLWPKRYATWGRLIVEQPGQIAYSLIDSRVVDSFMTTLYPPHQADTVEELCTQLGLPADAVAATLAEYNAAVRPGDYDPRGLDDCHTEGLEPPKSHWALPISEPPFYAYPLRPGITFTYLGVGVDDRARIKREGKAPFANLFAAGEVMSGNILLRGYLAGFGMTLGTVFGRIAGESAGSHVVAG